MSKIPVLTSSGESAGEVEVSDDLLVRDKGERVLQDSVLGYLAAQRAGTASTLSKGEVAGSNAKPWRQKGTGRARAGYRQSPVWRGGAAAFGPKPRSYKISQNRKARRLALRRAFTDKVDAGDVKILDDLKVAEPKTKLFAAILKALDLKKNVLFIVKQPDPATFLAARNLPKVEILPVSDVHPYHLVRYASVMITREAMAELESRLGGKAGSESEVTA